MKLFRVVMSTHHAKDDSANAWRWSQQVPTFYIHAIDPVTVARLVSGHLVTSGCTCTKASGKAHGAMVRRLRAARDLRGGHQTIWGLPRR